MQKRIMAINDLSCYGRCAASVTLPVLSAAGVECAILPTALLSTHLAYPNPPKLNTTDMIPAVTKHLKSLGVEFDAIATGYLDNAGQAAYIKDFFCEFKTPSNFILVDPTMADNGKMYGNPAYNEYFIKKMRELCTMADIVVPNITEAAFICDLPFMNGMHTEEYICKLLNGLCNLGPERAVVTGVVFEKGMIGSAVIDKSAGCVKYFFDRKFEGRYIGTGDLFASVILASLLNGFDIYEAADMATKHVSYCIDKSNKINTADSMAINFEQCMDKLIESLKNK